MRPTVVLIPSLMLAAMSGCAFPRTATQPIIEPSAPMLRGGEHDAVQDFRICESTVRDAAPVSMQPRWLPPLGAVENGVVLGMVDSPHPVWPLQQKQSRRESLSGCPMNVGCGLRTRN